MTCVSELCANAITHTASGRGGVFTVEVDCPRDGIARVAVTDDGDGFDTAKPTPGTGLQGMADRLAAQGMRVLGLAFKRLPPGASPSYVGLTWVGLVGLSDPLPIQYVRWLGDIAAGRLGTSFFRGDTVAELIAHRGPVSAEIGILALIMFASVEYDIPEWVTGLSGVAFILVSLWSSIRYKQRHDAEREPA